MATNWKEDIATIIHMMISLKLISYEIVWAILRIAPIVEYFLLEAHPVINRG